MTHSFLYRSLRATGLTLLCVALLACGGGGGGGGGSTDSGGSGYVPVSNPADASRFLSQASFGPSPADIARVQTVGYAAWLQEQMAILPTNPHQTYIDGLGAAVTDFDQNPLFESFWRQVATAPDPLRQRVAFALSQIFVISMVDLVDRTPKVARGTASYLDMLGRNAFGNFRTLLEDVTRHPMMGLYLSHLRNQKEDTVSGRVPDENYAREILQLFSIGLVELNLDGTPRLLGGNPIETYTNADIAGLARVFTGWSWGGADKTNNRFFGSTADPNRDVLPMQFYPSFHSTSAKTFLGTTIPANTPADTTLRLALDRIFNHANVGPFISKQLIQRLVTSNPTPAYVARVAQVFNNDGTGVRGNMRAVIAAIFLDSEARNAANLSNNQFGRLRDPIQRMAHWMRSFGAASVSGRYQLWNTDNPANSLGQSPMRSPSVFNFYRPGYVPPSTELATASLVAPELQITHETSVVGYINAMQGAIANGTGQSREIAANYSNELPLASNPAALVDRMNLLLMGGQMSSTLRSNIITAVTACVTPSCGSTAALNQRNRVNIAILLTMASPEYLVQK
ncbi:DUF1800 domain-containing protein [Parvibium lacunae]|uniref:DUF1800 domain-containing protein n=1 Tax=Parvibium lacunae TaxID=1888893 RepID=A0A368L045_9BURK|nr:DUF1800 domain-containing protein [Parvibium lacunae]RCS56764.1 DUF1800 domain-containing protein [Parvibium lacunae]